ncbi:DUF2125 domain-containing protein [Ovoidimarina sediminis]|uniref:DUF2125 domain-containing protein n=1 Tax=Ovoidimarina sediminis TaxID=3079856 RepID=UPI002908F75B|nr:DUF2125 domain-containing protein [Rhodophyticola sp. MJ-SS7]MDU8943777.1 DUF2125 domain-containing protein [Rhodophyticola sp. MJ-SS7]
MTRTTLMISAALAALSLPAQADVTADDVWESWQAMLEDTNQTLQVAQTTRENGTLRLEGLVSTLVSGGDTIVTEFDELTFDEQGDGTVLISSSPTFRITVDGDGVNGETVNMVILLNVTGAETIASGDPGNIDHAYTADRMEMVLDSIEASGDPFTLDFSVAADSVSGTYNWNDGSPRSIDNAFRAGALAASFSFDDPGEEAAGNMSLTMQSIEGQTSGTISPLQAGDELGAFLRAGLTSESTFASGPLAYKIDVTDPDEQFIIEGSNETASLSARLDADGLSYQSAGTGTAISFLAPGAMIPPISLEIAETSSGLRLPLLKSDEMQDFAISSQLTGLEVSDIVWSMIDPTGGLPRDPANLKIDITGKGRWLFELTDPAVMEQVEAEGEVPGEVQSVDINAMDLSVAGAALTGTGAFAFDNSTVPPTPAGAIDLRLVGANALLDSLVAIGLLPEDQAMGARMMLGLFARPGDGEDTLVSTIELKEDGSVIANGQRIR